MNKRLSAAVVAAALVFSSASASGADLGALARDLERVLGRGSVEVRGRQTPRRTDVVTDVALVDAMNRQRAAHGLEPLRLNTRLSLAANDRVEHMFEQRYFDHVAPDGTQPFIWISRRGYDYRMAGENLAVGYTTADRVVSGWIRSPGHRANLLGRGFEEIGVAVAPGAPLRGFGGPTIVALYASR